MYNTLGVLPFLGTSYVLVYTICIFIFKLFYFIIKKILNIPQKILSKMNLQYSQQNKIFIHHHRFVLPL